MGRADEGADRVRKRPGVIFGSDGLEGCEHAVFEILSNSIDEAREGHGNLIPLTYFEDKSIEVEDFGRGCPMDWNSREQRYNWELVYCELYAGGKYDADADTYAYSLGLNGLGLCATQFASEYMDVSVIRDGKQYTLHFEKGENVGGLQQAPAPRKATGTKTRWKPDLEVFTDIAVTDEWFRDVLKRQLETALTEAFLNAHDDAELQKCCILAYEPVWAIGTGKTATPQDADSAHAYIRSVIAKMFDGAVAENTIIQYGGSVKPGNVKDLMSMENIDGALVGGASLTLEQFLPIINCR